MKNRHKKAILFSVLSATIMISSCGSSGKVDPPRVEESMSEQLPNGQSKVVSRITFDKEMLEWLNKKQSELQLAIAEQMELDSNEVLIIFSPMPDSEHDGSNQVACSVVLKTDLTFEDKIINKVLEDIISAVTQDSVDVKISKENISIANNKGVKLN